MLPPWSLTILWTIDNPRPVPPWRRVKKGMPDRYRLFFRFASKPVKLIVYVWFNDEDTLRKAGSKTDVYEVFKRMLSRGQVPGGVKELLADSTS